MISDASKLRPLEETVGERAGRGDYVARLGELVSSLLSIYQQDPIILGVARAVGKPIVLLTREKGCDGSYEMYAIDKDGSLRVLTHDGEGVLPGSLPITPQVAGRDYALCSTHLNTRTSLEQVAVEIVRGVQSNVSAYMQIHKSQLLGGLSTVDNGTHK